MENLDKNLSKQHENVQFLIDELEHKIEKIEINERNQSRAQYSSGNEGINRDAGRVKVKRRGPQRHHAPWWNKECAEAVARRRLALNNFKKGIGEFGDTLKEYFAADKETKRITKNRKDEYYGSMTETKFIYRSY